MLLLGLIVVLIVLAYYLRRPGRSSNKAVKASDEAELPGPSPLPVIGSLHLMAKFNKYPFECFTRLKKIYGPIFQMKLGSVNTVIIHTEEDKKEVLVTKGDHFDGRPDWKRFDFMFGGSRRNALAFCDFDALQIARRKLLRAHTFPSSGGDLWSRLDRDCRAEMRQLVAELSSLARAGEGGEAIVDMKTLLTRAASNIFNSYFCSAPRRDYTDREHNAYCDRFDRIFWEVNTGRAVDFMPWLMPPVPAWWRPMRQVRDWATGIRDYVERVLVAGPRSEPGGLLECLLARVKQDAGEGGEDAVTRDIALYALEDILGGHCAVANTAIRALTDLGTRPALQARLRAELTGELAGAEFYLADKWRLPFMQATFNETVRHTCSAIVPHVATRNTSIAGYTVPANSVVFINNHFSNFSPDYWEEPEAFQPERFLRDGKFVKPTHFQPFSMGRRSCMGYKLIENMMAFLLANILSRFEVSCPDCMREQPGGILGLEPRPFNFTIRRLDTPSRANA